MLLVKDELHLCRVLKNRGFRLCILKLPTHKGPNPLNLKVNKLLHSKINMYSFKGKDQLHA